MLDQNKRQSQKMTSHLNPQTMVSLFDYLGSAAGSELGKQVAEYAKIRNVVIGSRYVKSPKYKGVILTYMPEFLDEFFKVKSVIGTNRSKNNTFQSNIL